MNHYSLEDISLGMKGSCSVQITENVQKMFTELSGDVNPMHLNKDMCISGGTGISWFMAWQQRHIILLW